MKHMNMLTLQCSFSIHLIETFKFNLLNKYHNHYLIILADTTVISSGFPDLG